MSRELQIGKAGEHLVCCDILMQGYNAFLADQGMPFDVVVESDGVFKRIQVKSTFGLRSFGKTATDIYRFGTRRGNGSKNRVRQADVDYFAFVCLDSMIIAYVPILEMMARSGGVRKTMDFKSRAVEYKGRVYSNGTRRTPDWGKYIEDYGKFDM